jgi:hypothetical protein
MSCAIVVESAQKELRQSRGIAEIFARFFRAFRAVAILS